MFVVGLYIYYMDIYGDFMRFWGWFVVGFTMVPWFTTCFNNRSVGILELHPKISKAGRANGFRVHRLRYGSCTLRNPVEGDKKNTRTRLELLSSKQFGQPHSTSIMSLPH